MPTFPFMQVDAFTDRPLTGNPCAIVFNADSLSNENMLAIAREMNLSETAFVVRSQVADFGARAISRRRKKFPWLDIPRLQLFSR